MDTAVDETHRLQRYQQRARQLLAVQRCIHTGLNNPQHPAHRSLLRHLSIEAKARQDEDENEEEVTSGVNVTRGGCDFRSVLRLGDHVSATLFAPQSWRPPARLVGGFPPAPQPEHMQKGLLGTLFSRRFSSSSSSTLPPAAATSNAAAVGTSEGSEQVKNDKNKNCSIDNFSDNDLRRMQAVDGNGSNSSGGGGGDRAQKRPRSPSPPAPVTVPEPAPGVINGLGGGRRRPQESADVQAGAGAGAGGGGHGVQASASTNTNTINANTNTGSNPTKKSRTININFGFESDSEDEDEDEDDVE